MLRCARKMTTPARTTRATAPPAKRKNSMSLEGEAASLDPPLDEDDVSEPALLEPVEPVPPPVAPVVACS